MSGATLCRRWHPTESIALLAMVFLLAGLSIAVQEALEASLTASYVQVQIRGISYGLPGSVNGLGDLISSAAVGFLWTTISPVPGLGLATLLMGIGTIAMARLHSKRTA
jgi:hypothetical protein